jgi:hypothetical protein
MFCLCSVLSPSLFSFFSLFPFRLSLFYFILSFFLFLVSPLFLHYYPNFSFYFYSILSPPPLLSSGLLLIFLFSDIFYFTLFYFISFSVYLFLFSSFISFSLIFFLFYTFYFLSFSRDFSLLFRSVSPFFLVSVGFLLFFFLFPFLLSADCQLAVGCRVVCWLLLISCVKIIFIWLRFSHFLTK